jgi:hypothetical protein
MPTTPDLYVQAIPKFINHLSGQPVGEKTAIVEVPGARIDRYRKEKRESQMTNEKIAEDLVQGIVTEQVAKATNIGAWQLSFSDCGVVNECPEVIKSRPADFETDGMRGWIL